MFGHVSSFKSAWFPWWWNSYWLYIQLSGMYSAFSIPNCTAIHDWFWSYIHRMLWHLHWHSLAGRKGFWRWSGGHRLTPLSRMMCCSYPRRRPKLFPKAGWVLSWCLSDPMDNEVDINGSCWIEWFREHWALRSQGSGCLGFQLSNQDIDKGLEYTTPVHTCLIFMVYFWKSYIKNCEKMTRWLEFPASLLLFCFLLDSYNCLHWGQSALKNVQEQIFWVTSILCASKCH